MAASDVSGDESDTEDKRVGKATNDEDEDMRTADDDEEEEEYATHPTTLDANG